ncbi:SDR family oxidoreductase [Caldimonas brevitalea]|nr:SDR family oxidoreductase [Caldimonas brevitalea]
MHFSGRVAVMTGAGHGIGRATALAFAAQGLKVLVADVDIAGGETTVGMVRDAGGDASFIRCDVTSEDDVRTSMDTAVSRFGRLDYAFNNAGIDIERTKLAEGSMAEYQAIMDVNVRGVWLCMKHQIPIMLKQGGGAIVNTGSTSSLHGAPRMSIYAASKHAVIGLTKSAAIEYGRKNIRINAVCPAVIDTDMYRRAVAEDERVEKQVLSAHPVGRIGRAEEVAGAVLYLCSDAAAFTTGIALPVDGGFSAI